MATFSQDMVIIHRIFRREFAIMPGIVRAAPAGDAERTAVLTEHLQLLLDVLDHHHAGEDLLLWPRLRDRAHARAALFDAMDGDHRTLHDDLTRLDDLVASWRSSASEGDRDALAAALDAVGPPLVAHLDSEEREVLPLVEELLTPRSGASSGSGPLDYCNRMTP